MANAKKGEYKIEANGNSVTLKYTTNALCELENKMGLSIPEIGQKILGGENISFAAIRTLFWAGLIATGPEVTEAEAGELIDAIGFQEATNGISHAFALAFPEAGPQESNEEANEKKM
jgi:hypothetical protein